MNRLSELLHKKDEFLRDSETLIYVCNGEMIARHHDGENLFEVSGEANAKLIGFLNWLQEDHQ